MDTTEKIILYNPHPHLNDEEVISNRMALQGLFVTRRDKCGVQWHQPDRAGRCGYTNIMVQDSDMQLLKHVRGEESMALPPFTAEDVCYWLGYDFDDHDGSTPQYANVRALTAVFRLHNIPHLVERSGTNSGHHVIVPIVPAKTLSAYTAARVFLKEAGLTKKDNIEIFPEQEKTSPDKYGSQLRLPLGYNFKAGAFSQLVDSETLEPVVSVTFSHLLRLREIQEPPRCSAKPKQRRATTADHPLSMGGPMRQCLLNALDQQLNGEAGHSTRLAIAREAYAAGLAVNEIVWLFEPQADFDYAVTRMHVESVIKKDYGRWRCDTLRDKCSEYVDCTKCAEKLNCSIDEEVAESA